MNLPLPAFAVASIAILLGFPSVGCLAEPVRSPVDSGEKLRIAFTFDDLPFVGLTDEERCDGREVIALNRRLLGAIRDLEMPATGLVVGSRACGARPEEVLQQILSLWLDEGHELGNHTHSHRDLNTVPLDWYLDDITRGQAPLEPLLVANGQTVRWFRPPLLHSGDTSAKKDGLDRFLREHGYRLAPVTIDNQEWVFAAVYESATKRGDDALVSRVVAEYVDHIEENLVYYEDLSDRVFGRQIPQVLLLHANLLNSDHLDKVATMVRERGYELISLSEATADPAYQSRDDYVGSRGLSWLQRWALSSGIKPSPEPREPEWLQREMGRRE